MANIQVDISYDNHHLQQQQFTPTTQTSSLFNHFFRQESSDISNVFEVVETNFKDYFYKTQVRRAWFAYNTIYTSVCRRHICTIIYILQFAEGIIHYVRKFSVKLTFFTHDTHMYVCV